MTVYILFHDDGYNSFILSVHKTSRLAEEAKEAHVNSGGTSTPEYYKVRSWEVEE